jgi:hypothetical protein
MPLVWVMSLLGMAMALGMMALTVSALGSGKGHLKNYCSGPVKFKQHIEPDGPGSSQ